VEQLHVADFNKLIVAYVVKKFLSFVELGRFITPFTTALHCTLSWARGILSIRIYDPF
jgi:hypothetical protein